MPPKPENIQLVNSWLKLQKALQPDGSQNPATAPDLFQNPIFFQNRPKTAQPNQINTNSNFRPTSAKTPIFSTISSIKNLLSAKAHSRPHFRPGTANPRLTSQNPMEFISSMSMADFQRLRKETETIHSLKVDDILDIYTAKCKDNEVEYIPSQALKFLEKFKLGSKLKKFELRELNLGLEAAKVIYKILAKNEHFIKLEFEKNSFSDLGAIILADALRTSQSIIHVNMCSNDIGPEGAQALFGCLLENNTIISLDLSSKEGLNRNRLGTQGVESLEWILQKNKTLQFLNLGSTSIGLTGLECILAGLENNSTLITLDIANNELGPQSSSLIANTLYTTQLLELNLSNNKLTDAGIDKLAAMFRISTKNTILEKIDLSNNQITSLGVAKLFDALQKNPYLKRLVLSNNRFSGRGFNNITYLLWENATLTHLELRNCDIESEGGEALANGLSKNEGLQYLMLSNNNLKDDGCKSIAGALVDNKKIKCLDLSKCRLRDGGGVPLAQIAKTHPTLHYLWLRENTLHDETGLALTDAAKSNRNLKCLACERNPISYKYMLEIRKAIETNILNYKKKRVPTYYRKVIDLKGLEGQKENVIEETIELEIAEKKNREELDEQRFAYQRQKDEERKRNDLLETELQNYMDDLRNADQSKEKFEKDIKQSIIDLETNIRATEDDIGKEAQEIARLENEARLLKEKQQTRKIQLEAKVQELRRECAEWGKQANWKEASYKSFEVQVQNFRNKVNSFGAEVKFDVEENEGDQKDKKKFVKKMSRTISSRQSLDNLDKAVAGVAKGKKKSPAKGGKTQKKASKSPKKAATKKGK